MVYEAERDEDRLPWLEPVEPDDPETSGTARIAFAALICLALLAAIVAAGYRFLGERMIDGGGALIAAPQGSYKIKPDDPGGLQVTGEGDTAIATSAGVSGNGAIDWTAVPEAPITARRINASANSPAAGGSIVDLGEFPSEAAATAAWTALAKRFAYVAPFAKQVTALEAGESRLYRLRIDAGSAEAARDLCGRLKVAGEKCLVTS